MLKRRLPKLYAPVNIRFWSLRTKLGQNGGVVFDCDEEVMRRCMRVRTNDGWKWQLIGLSDLLDWDATAWQDQEILTAYGESLEYERA